ncbi:uncharacterized protein LOC134812708 [Bolinopsis microptera]|uniref:uncharacterized protein LOC134812708 n=1 Tax=Bolinopsis microptera TaxID=2820187 RepID=UPI0030796F90
MLAIEEAQMEGGRVKKLIEELVKCEVYEETVWITIGLFSSMQVLVSGAPVPVKERVQLVLSRLVTLSEDVDRSSAIDESSRTNLVEIAKSLGAVSETLVNWYTNKRLRQESEGGSERGVPLQEVDLVRKFSNFLTRRSPRVYLPTLSNPDTVLEMAYALFCKSHHTLLTEYKQTVHILAPAQQSEQVVRILVTASSLLDIEDRLFVNRFPYRAQVFSFTEKLVRYFRNKNVPGSDSESDSNVVSVLSALLEAVSELVSACRERLTGNISLKRAESMALRPGGPLPTCLFNLRDNSQNEDSATMSVTLKFRVTNCDGSSVGLGKMEDIVLETMRLATVKCITKKLGVKIRRDPKSIMLTMEGGGVISDNTSLRAGDLSKRNLFISINSGTELAGTSLTALNVTRTTFAKAVKDFEAAGSHNLSLSIGDIVQVTDKTSNVWWEGICNKRSGTFPPSCVKDMSDEEAIETLLLLNGTSSSTSHLTSTPEHSSKRFPEAESPKRTPKRAPNSTTPESKTPRWRGRFVRNSDDNTPRQDTQA